MTAARASPHDAWVQIYLGLFNPPTYRLHVAPLPSNEVQDYASIRLTAPGRSIVDAAIAGTEPRQIIMAVWQALERRITTPEELRALASRGPDTSHRGYVQRIIDETIADHAAQTQPDAG